MKKKFFRVLFFCFVCFGAIFNNYAQSSNDAEHMHLDNLAKQMFVDINNRDFDALLQMTHPKVFEILPKEDMKNFLKSMFEGTEELSIDMPKIIPNYKLSEIYNIEKDTLKFAFVSYDMNFKMTFNNQEFDDDAKEMMLPIMEAQGMEVEFLSNKTMSVLVKDSLTIILKDNNTNNEWVMANYNPDSPFFYQIMPSALMEKAKEYKQNLMLERKKNSEN
ncbi:hypothetical protein EV196_11043 [Mariniflexile fucanivorans]|uniref:Uncharacterized protein n=1 Tax=Mariniflexile fucanivorans TaxID=264023 RepID=A0A4R1RBD4_9FLAO|nr:hypothetical protein [Mariniflexile fucanivorans]TCL63091.1 hypothetical protein EV196_11043 [Mariniflexile fucanivorans]